MVLGEANFMFPTKASSCLIKALSSSPERYNSKPRRTRRKNCGCRWQKTYESATVLLPWRKALPHDLYGKPLGESLEFAPSSSIPSSSCTYYRRNISSVCSKDSAAIASLLPPVVLINWTMTVSISP